MAETHPLRLALIVPTLEDDAALARLLATIRRLADPPEEVIVADGAAGGAVAALCGAARCTRVVCRPGRGWQLRAGIDAARASAPDVLWMVHADCEPHELAAQAIRAAVRTGAAGGYFRFRFGGVRGAAQRFLEFCIAWRCRASMVYGDQGIFLTRAAYEAGPGIAPRALFEEVPLVRALRRTRRFRALPLPITVDARRWQHDGLLRRTLRNRALAVGFALGVDPERLARGYRAARLPPEPGA